MTAKTQTAKRTPPTPGQVIAEQRRQAAGQTAARKAAVPAPVKAPAAAMATPDTRTEAEKWNDELAPSLIVGRLIKFSKAGEFVFADDDETPIDENTNFVVLADQTLAGWIKFFPPDANGNRPPPERVMGLLYDKNFVKPEREQLSDNDASQWPVGLSGKVEDPWKKQQCLVLQNTTTQELATFVTVSKTGNRAASSLLKHYDRMLRMGKDALPVVRLRPGGYNDPQFGWVATPMFAIVGRAPRDSAAKPDTSVAADLNDEIPHLH